MRVEFTRHTEKGRLACHWVATRPPRTRVPGSFMPAGRHLPHDLAQYVVEAATSTTDGFWGLIARGATFRSTGRRVTKPGRAIILEHRGQLDRAEIAANACIASWHAGEPTPASAALDAALRQWRDLRPTERLVFEWPSAVGEVLSANR